MMMERNEIDLLSDNEKTVLEMYKNDREVNEIAETLGVSVHTVKAHIAKLEKLKLI